MGDAGYDVPFETGSGSMPRAGMRFHRTASRSGRPRRSSIQPRGPRRGPDRRRKECRAKTRRALRGCGTARRPAAKQAFGLAARARKTTVVGSDRSLSPISIVHRRRFEHPAGRGSEPGDQTIERRPPVTPLTRIALLLLIASPGGSPPGARTSRSRNGSTVPARRGNRGRSCSRRDGMS